MNSYNEQIDTAIFQVRSSFDYIIASIFIEHKANATTYLDLINKKYLTNFQIKLIQVIYDLHNSRTVELDIVSIHDELQQKHGIYELARLGDLAKNRASLSNIKAYINAINAKSRLISLKQQLKEVLEMDFTSLTQEHVTEHIATLQSMIDTLSDQTQDVREVEISSEDFLASYVNEMEKRANGITNLVDIGIPNTSVTADSLNIIGGRPGMGKTALAIHIANHITTQEKEKEVLIFSLEMPARQIMDRFISKKTRLAVSVLQDPINSSLEQDYIFSKIGNAFEEFKEQKIKVVDSVTNPDLIIKKIRETANNGKLGCVIIDYLGLMVELSTHFNKTEVIADITKKLKRLAIEINVPIILLSQLNRLSSNENREPKASDLRDSGAIEQDADLILFPYRDFNDEENQDLAKIIVAKNRHGEAGVSQIMNFQFGNFYFTENNSEEWQGSDFS